VPPNEGRLCEAVELSAALRGAGIQDVQVQRREYRIGMQVSDYLEMQDVFTYGRFVRATLGPVRWPAFREEVEQEIRMARGDQIEYTTHYHLAVGGKPRCQPRRDVYAGECDGAVAASKSQRLHT